MLKNVATNIGKFKNSLQCATFNYNAIAFYNDLLHNSCNIPLMQNSNCRRIALRTQTFSSKISGSDDKNRPEVLNHADVPIIDYNDPDYLPLPEYPLRPDEPLEVRKQR